MARLGKGKGKGKGYKNIMGKDPAVHSQSARGMKQPQRINENMMIDRFAEANKPKKSPVDMSWQEIEQIYGEVAVKDFEIENVFIGIGSEGVTSELDEFGNVSYPNGLGKALEQVGGVKLSKSEIKNLLEEVDGEKPKTDDDLYDALNEYETDNTYNQSPALADTYNYGFIETDDGKTYFIFKTHLGGDVRGNYTDQEVYDINELDLGYTGEPKGDMIPILNPEIYIKGNIHGKEAEYVYHGGGSGFDTTDSSQPDIQDDYSGMEELYESFIQRIK